MAVSTAGCRFVFVLRFLIISERVITGKCVCVSSAQRRHSQPLLPVCQADIWHRNYQMKNDKLFLYLLYVRKFIMKSISPGIWSSRVRYRYNTITALFFCHFSWFVLYKSNWTVVNKIDLMVCICCILSCLNLKITSGNLDLGVGVFVVCVRVSLYILLLTQ